MRTFIAVLFSFFISTCASTEEPAPTEAPPSEWEEVLPDFHYTPEEADAYSKKFQASDDDILYYFVIGPDGTVVNAALIDWKREKYSEEFATEFKKISNAMKFEKTGPDAPTFREGFFPVKVCDLTPDADYCEES